VDALGDVTAMRDRLMWAMDNADLTHSQKQEWLSHLHFAKLPLTGMSDVGANFIPYLVSSVCGSESDKHIATLLLVSMQLRGQGYENTVLMQMGQWRASRKVLDITSGIFTSTCHNFPLSQISLHRRKMSGRPI